MTRRSSCACLPAVGLLLLTIAPRAAGQKATGPPPPPTQVPQSANPLGGFNPITKNDLNSLIVFGTVTLADGAPPGELVMIERVCKGITQTGGFADSKGRFSFDLGVLNQQLGFAGQIEAQSSSQLSAKNIKPDDLKDCEVRGSLAGYRSQTLSLKPAATGRRPQLGTMVLKPLGKEEALALSTSDGQAPKNAKKAYEQGLDAAAKAKWQEAMASFEKAVSLYPKYASAWLSLGILQAGSNTPPAALKSFGQATAADERFALPYIESATLESMGGQWERVVELTAKAIEIGPDSFPRAYWLNALAHMNLHHIELAEKSAAAGLALDDEHKYPDLEYVEGIALLGKNDKEGAAKHLQNYVSLDPRGTYAAFAQKQLAALTSAR